MFIIQICKFCNTLYNKCVLKLLKKDIFLIIIINIYKQLIITILFNTK